MSIEILERRFAEIGAQVKAEGPWRGMPRIDVNGPYFSLHFAGNGREVGVEVVDVRREDRHLLLLVRNGDEKSKFLCGFDERHWFVAAIPESARGVSGVDAAKAALQPEPVREAASGLRKKERSRRRTSAYVRQGEWFFVPVANLRVVESQVRRDEPLSRGHGKVHMLQFAYRRGGEVVYVNWEHPAGISEERYSALTQRERLKGNWQLMSRDPELFAKGAVSHPDHATIVLRDWHRVLMNTEQAAQAMRHVAFLD